MVQLVDRDQWGARSPKGITVLQSRPKGVKIHFVGDRVDPAIVNSHGKCLALAKSIQKHHMDTNLWGDIGYTGLICPHRQLLLGRGPGLLPAANGNGLNSNHYAIMAMVGTSGLVVPPDDMLHGLVDAFHWLRRLPAKEKPCGQEVLGHRDGWDTDCPGEWLYAWIQRGYPRPDGGAPPAPGADMPPWPGRVLEYPPAAVGDDVLTWQKQMRRRGWPITVDGSYGPQSRDIARQFQMEKGLRTSGKVGRDDWEAAWLAPIT
ncbi:N-acetylmuramoyl-L-alanine amidase [Streptosporangium sp. NPDC002721]|uniref:peptidoglycan recognition protein family protein n=1 Tax=Streptosporangium sp. NPDC002721 TaxID=3366188 RepID=UPI00368D417B